MPASKEYSDPMEDPYRYTPFDMGTYQVLEEELKANDRPLAVVTEAPIDKSSVFYKIGHALGKGYADIRNDREFVKNFIKYRNRFM